MDKTNVDAVEEMGSGSFISTQDHDVMLQPYNNEPHPTVEVSDPQL